MADIVWDTTVLPDCIIGAPYQASLAFHANATALSAASSASPALPTGLTFGPNRNTITGTYTGNPTTWSGTITLTDTAGAVASSTMTINCRYATEADVVDLGANYEGASLGRLWPLTF